jgi:6-phosphogluconolactonase (cycloisomerase 2 family)
MKTNRFLRYALTFGVALFLTGPAFTQLTSTAPPANGSTAATAPVAYVYVGTSKGTNLYNAAPNGKLTLVAGSPFKTTGLMIGSNRKFFITLGINWVRSYPVKANGAIGAQVSQINTQNYNGRDCGTTNGAVLDHSGQDVYVLLNVPPDGNNVCDAYQTFKIATTSGQLTFNGSTTQDNTSPPVRNLPTFLASNKFAYAINNFRFLTTVDLPGGSQQDLYLNGESTFTRESNGTLEYLNLDWGFPPPFSLDEGEVDYLWKWIPLQVTADATNHLAVAMYPWYDPPKGSHKSPQLASFTVDSQGHPVSTNTYKNMPLPDVFPAYMNMSPDGKLLAVAGGTSGGLQVFHFNGAAPITKYSKVLTTGLISWIRWDKTHHLYALSTNGKLFVYTITPTSIAAAPGSPYTVNGPAGVFVVPK